MRKGAVFSGRCARNRRAVAQEVSSTPMVEFTVHDLEDEIRDRLVMLAAAHGRSLEEEIREILREAARRVPARTSVGLGSALVELFRGCDLQDGEIVELRHGSPKPPGLRS